MQVVSIMSGVAARVWRGIEHGMDGVWAAALKSGSGVSGFGESRRLGRLVNVPRYGDRAEIFDTVEPA